MIYQRSAGQTYSPLQLLVTYAGSQLSLPCSSWPPYPTLFGRGSCLAMLSISFPLPLMVLSCWNLFHPKGNCILAFVTIQFLLTMEEGAVNNETRLSHWRDENEILFGTGKESFSLEKKSGKKRSMLSERDLVITWSHTPRYWKWNSNPASRFPEVAELITVCWLEIRGKINTSMLSPSILYTANLAFQVLYRILWIQ